MGTVAWDGLWKSLEMETATSNCLTLLRLPRRMRQSNYNPFPPTSWAVLQELERRNSLGFQQKSVRSSILAVVNTNNYKHLLVVTVPICFQTLCLTWWTNEKGFGHKQEASALWYVKAVFHNVVFFNLRLRLCTDRNREPYTRASATWAPTHIEKMLRNHWHHQQSSA